MKHIPNIISLMRIVMSIELCFCKTFSIVFYILYILCGISDVMDGFLARKINAQSDTGAIIDSIGDIIFVIVSFCKIIPRLQLNPFLIAIVIIVASMRIANVIVGYCRTQRLVLLHTTANKITGLLLFMLPLSLWLVNENVAVVIVSAAAVAATIDEFFKILKNETKQEKQKW